MDDGVDDSVGIEIALRDYIAHTVPALDIEAYAEVVYQANRLLGL